MLERGKIGTQRRRVPICVSLAERHGEEDDVIRPIA